MNQAGSVLSDAAHSFTANLAGGKDAPDQQRSLKKSNRDWCYQFLGKEELGAAIAPLQMMLQLQGGSRPSPNHLLPQVMASLCLGVSLPMQPIAAAPCPHGGQQWGDGVERAGLPGWLVVGCGGVPHQTLSPCVPLAVPSAVPSPCTSGIPGCQQPHRSG